MSCFIQGSNCCFLAQIQVSQKTSKMVWYSHLSKSFPQFVMKSSLRAFHSQRLQRSWWKRKKCFFLKLPCFLYNLTNAGNLISSSSSFFKPSLDIWKFLVPIMLMPSMQDFKYVLTSMGDEWWGLTFSSPVATAESSRFADITNAKPWWHHPLGI